MCQDCGGHGSELTKETITVEGMTCGHCKSAVEKAVRGLPGVFSADVDLTAKTLQVEFDSHKSSLAAIKQAVEDVGFEVP